MTIEPKWPGWSLGSVLALGVAITCLVLSLVHGYDTRLLLIGIVAVSRLC